MSNNKQLNSALAERHCDAEGHPSSPKKRDNREEGKSVKVAPAKNACSLRVRPQCIYHRRRRRKRQPVSVASSSLSNGGTWNSWIAGTALLDVEDRSERLSRFLCADCGVSEFSSISDEGGERESARNFHAPSGPLTASGLEGEISLWLVHVSVG